MTNLLPLTNIKESLKLPEKREKEVEVEMHIPKQISGSIKEIKPLNGKVF